MPMEYKSVPAAVKAIEGRVVTGIFAVHGNLDSYHDISHPGSFSKTLSERQKRVKFLWGHDFYSPPTAVIKGIREVARDELPEAVLERAPTATGGVEVVREYLTNERASEVFEAVASGANDEMSYGYDALRFDFQEVDGVQVRNLREVRLWEVSDVLFGANPATAGSKLLMPPEALMKHIEALLQELKEGRRNAGTDQERINLIAQLAAELGADNIKLLDADAAKGTGVPPADDERRADPVPVPVSLTLEKARLFLLDTLLDTL